MASQIKVSAHHNKTAQGMPHIISSAHAFRRLPTTHKPRHPDVHSTPVHGSCCRDAYLTAATALATQTLVSMPCMSLMPPTLTAV